MTVSVPVTLSVDVGAPSPDYQKTQRERAFLALFAGPVLAYHGVKSGGLSGIGVFMVGAGLSIVAGSRYLRDRHVALALPAPPPGIPPASSAVAPPIAGFW